MKPLRSVFVGGLLLIFALTACNLPTGNSPAVPAADAAQTAAAQTVQAVLTSQPGGSNPTQPPVAPGSTLPATPIPPTAGAAAPTSAPPTAVPQAPTATPRPCNQATFVADVTVPDGSKMPPGNNFTKVWRLKNVGTCSWTTQYALVFTSGAQMGGPSVQQLTQVVNPGETVDIAVDLTAPNAAGSYRGYWKIRDANGNTFGLSNGNAFWVDIQVEAAAPTSTPFVFLPPVTFIPTIVFLPNTVTLDTASEGAVFSTGAVFDFPNVGDTSLDEGAQAFISFDLSSIPAGASLTSVQLDFSDYDTLGDPFGALGCLRLYGQDFGSVDASDYFTGNATGSLVRWCDVTELNAQQEATSQMVSYLESRLGGLAQFRLQFKSAETNSNNAADMVRFGTLRLIITYTNP